MVVRLASMAGSAALLCAPASALTLTCERGVAGGTKIGPPHTYTLTVKDAATIVGYSNGKSNTITITKRIETDEMRALVLDNGDPSVQAILILWPNPRLELTLGGGLRQTDLCKASNS